MDREDIIDGIIRDLELSLFVRDGKLHIILKIDDKIISKDFVHLTDLQED